MKAVALLIGLCACASSGQQWSGYQRPYQRIPVNDYSSYAQSRSWAQQLSPYGIQKSNAGEFSPIFLAGRNPFWNYKYPTQRVGLGLPPNDNLNTYAKLIDNNYADNELSYNGIQNNLSYNRGFYGDVSVKKRADGSLVQVLNKQPWANPYQTECYGIVEIIKDLSLVTHTNSIVEEKQNLKTLFSIVREFILNNNLQNAPFSMVVYEIGKILLNDNDDAKPLREKEIDLIVQRFKDQDLYNLILEIRSRPELSIRAVVLKLARLLHRLKQDMVVKGLPGVVVTLVINRVVQLSVPIIGYHFEKECKIKTQRYIIQNLEVALNLKLEDTQHLHNVDNVVNWGGLDNSASAAQAWGLSNRESLGVIEAVGSVGGAWNEGVVNGLGVVSQGSQLGVGNVESVGSVGNQGSLAGLANVENVDALETQVGSGISVNVGSQGNLGEQVGPLSTGNTQEINGIENLISPNRQGILVAT